jgi:hypothetical protein
MKEVTVNTTPNPEIEKLRTEKERNEAKLRYCKNQLIYPHNINIKYLYQRLGNTAQALFLHQEGK